MSRTSLLPDKPSQHYTRAEALEAIDLFLIEQERVGRQGERLIAVNMDRCGLITSVKCCERPAVFKRLEKPA